MHRAIVIPLMKSLIAMRKDCSFIVSTHELELPSEVKGAKVCIVRSATWDQYANVTSWDIDLVEVSAIPDDLRTDLLGSRRKILFIEGGFSSLDKPLYAVLFPKVSTIPRDGCREVARAVVGLRTTAELHRAEAYGLIDGDGMSTSQAEEYKSQGVFALSVYAVESLYYAPELQLAVAQRQAETHKSELEEQQALGSQYVNDAKSRALAALNLQGKLEHLASRVAERQLRDLVIASIPSRDQMVSGTSADITLTLPSPTQPSWPRSRRLRQRMIWIASLRVTPSVKPAPWMQLQKHCAFQDEAITSQQRWPVFHQTKIFKKTS